jgi:histidinol-phosphate aminotransferase
LRVGYLVGPARLVEYLHRVRLSFNVGSVAQVAARAALDDVEHVERSRRANATELPLLKAGLERLGLKVAPSQGNFLLVDFGPREARAVYEALLRRGIIVRPTGLYQLPRHLRITVGKPEENQRLLQALPELL